MLVTDHRDEILGEIVDGVVGLSKIGQIVDELKAALEQFSSIVEELGEEED